MAEWLILKKPLPWGNGSLVRRIFLSVAILLVLPLFFHTVFLYIREYKEDIKTVKNFLTILQESKEVLFEGIIREKEQDLQQFSGHADHLEFTEIQTIEPSLQENPFFTRIDSKKPLLWVGKNISSEEAIGTPIDLEKWVFKGKHLDEYAFPVTISIRDKQGILISGRRLDLQERQVAVQTQIADTDLILELSVPLSAIQRYEIDYYAYSVFTLVVLIGLLGGIGVFLLMRRMAKPFEGLRETMQKVSEGAQYVRYLPDKMGFEINTLGMQFNQTVDELLKRTKEAEAERLERESLLQQLKIGHQIQRSMLPASLPELPGLDVAPGYLAAQEVSGDFYDLFPLDDHRFLFVVADSAGKGISACLYSLGFRSALRAFALTGSSLADIIKQANDLLLLDTGNSGFFITAWIGIYDVKTKTLEYCSQGHPPALLKRQGELQELSTHGISFGVEELIGDSIKSIILQNGDFLLLYTDGILEAHNPNQQFFGKKRLENLILRSEYKFSEQFIENLFSEIQLFSHGSPQYDDITFLVMIFSR
jgi:serine phosphatase RsbU (regulator of sigma subunit)